MNLPEAVAQVCDELVPVLDASLGSWVRGVGGAVPAAPTVVVVGETQRGKSSLVNALLAAPDLSPVRDGVATSTRLVVSAAKEWSATAHYVDCCEPVDPTALADHALLTSSRTPRCIEVGAPIPLLDRFSLVDTPGVGGLNGSAAAFLLDPVPTALLMVLDASAPISRAELDFLHRISEQVETVLFVLTKIDLQPDWRTMLDAGRDALADTRFATAPWFPVSAELFRGAGEATDPEVAAAMRRRSGIAELQIAVQQQVTNRSAMLAAANTLRALDTAVAAELTRARLALATASADERQAAARIRALEHRRDELDAIRTAPGREWQLRLRAELARARIDCGHDVTARSRVAHSRLRATIDHSPVDRLDVVPHQVDAALQALAARIGVALTERVAGVLDRAFTELFSEAERTELRAELTRAGPVVTLRPPERRPTNTEDAVLVVVGFSGGLGIGRIAALPLAGLGAAASTLVLPVSLALGLGAGWWMARTRRTAANRAHLRQWLGEVFGEARSALDRAVAEQMIDAEQQLGLALDKALAVRQASVDAELTAVRRSLGQAVADRDRAGRLAADRVATLDAGRGRITALLTRITELRDRT